MIKIFYIFNELCKSKAGAELLEEYGAIEFLVEFYQVLCRKGNNELAEECSGIIKNYAKWKDDFEFQDNNHGHEYSGINFHTQGNQSLNYSQSGVKDQILGSTHKKNEYGQGKGHIYEITTNYTRPNGAGMKNTSYVVPGSTEERRTQVTDRILSTDRAKVSMISNPVLTSEIIRSNYLQKLKFSRP